MRFILLLLFTLSVRAAVTKVPLEMIVGGTNIQRAPGITKPKTCKAAYGGASATLAAPTECSAGTCTEIFDNCGTALAPAFIGAGQYTNLTFAAGTFANDTFVDCGCKAWDATTGNARPCTLFWETGDNSIKTSSTGGYVTNVFTTNSSGVSNDTYFQVSCEGSSP